MPLKENSSSWRRESCQGAAPGCDLVSEAILLSSNTLERVCGCTTLNDPTSPVIARGDALPALQNFPVLLTGWLSFLAFLAQADALWKQGQGGDIPGVRNTAHPSGCWS